MEVPYPAQLQLRSQITSADDKGSRPRRGKNNSDLRFYLSASGEPVSGPSGLIQIRGAQRAAVLLNGKSPEYTVGHGDIPNNHVGWAQQLAVPAGTHELTLNYKGKELWSGKVNVPVNKRVIIYVD